MTTVLPTHPVVGYARVSTDSQRDEGGLEVQVSKLTAFATSLGMPLLHVYQESAHAGDPGNVSGRRELVSALYRCQEARRRGLTLGIVVTDVKRLDRDPESRVPHLLMGIPVYSLANGGLVDATAIHAGIQSGADGVVNIRSGTKQGLRKTKASGKKLGSPSDNRIAAAASIEVRREKSKRTVEKLLNYFRNHPHSRHLPMRHLADALNRDRILNSCGRPWNATNVREKRRQALHLWRPVATQRELSNDELEYLREVIGK